ncbi:Putative DNA-3-methyladenine glycosylase YfjP [Vanrija pseudolonga]|uniref:DNA-3-methyladenine glycosylase YfjP n=1 Tax=Vanrija pseudolonga TaxID=143232 RepID=A0AAF1BI41_9TREE|nr:Putative DNA-3-methyladenine glycosylase YfjP [Vanrija pseudolonga]
MPPKAKAVAAAAATAVRVTRSRGASAVAVAGADNPFLEVKSEPKPAPAAPKRTPKKAKAEAEPSANGDDTAEAATPRKKRKVAAAPAPPAPRRSYTPPPPFSLPDAVAHLTSVDARFASLFARTPCKPFLHAIAGPAAPPSIDPFRTLVTSIIGQQVSWMAARSITRRFVELFFGESANGGRYDEDGVFPTREQVAKVDVPALRGVGFSNRKAEYVIGLANDFVAGRLTDDLLLNGTDEEVAAALIAVRGIGQWTVDMFLIFSLARPNILPVGDLGVQKGLLRWVLAAHGALPPPPVRTPKKGKKASASASASASQEVEPETPTKTPRALAPSDSTATLIVPLTPTAESPFNMSATLVPSTPGASGVLSTPGTSFPSTPGPPPVTPSASMNPTLPKNVPDACLHPPDEWAAEHAARAAPLPDGLTIATLKSRLAGKKAKGNVYLLPEEMEALTQHWKPYRSVGTFYTWSMIGEDN